MLDSLSITVSNHSLANNFVAINLDFSIKKIK
jgi:hypothetical protein